MPGLQSAEHVATVHELTDHYGGGYRLVGGAQAAGMVDRDDGPAGHHAGVGHRAVTGGEHRLAG